MKLTTRQKRLWEFVKEYYQKNRFDASHRIDHVERVLKWCGHLISHEPTADSKILIPACICHDMALPFVPEKEHARKALEHARDILKKAGYSDVEIRKIGEVMKQHSYDDKILRERTIEGDIIYDADKLDSTGPIGVWRLLYETVTKKFPTVRECIKNYLRILGNLPKYSPGKHGGFFTPKGGEIAKERLPYTIKVLKAILKDSY